MVLGCLLCSFIQAGPLYLAQVKRADVNNKVLQKALAQVKERKDIEVLDNLAVMPFHKRGVLQVTEKLAFCMNCHLPLPHRKNKRNRTFLNMHSLYIACETCHFRPKGIALDYRWLAYSGADAGQVLSPRSSSIRDPSHAVGKNRIVADSVVNDKNGMPKRERKNKIEKRQLLAPLPGARIAPFYDGVPVLLFKEDDFALTTKQVWVDGSEQARAELKAKLHLPLEKAGPACKNCHRKDQPMFDLHRLGATPQRLKAMQNNTIVRFFTRFKKDESRIRLNKLLR